MPGCPLTPGGWGVYDDVDDGCVHVVPLDDRWRHAFTAGCRCLPRVEDGVVIHEALRE